MKKVYILGSGAIGLALAAYLTHNGKKAIAVRTSDDKISKKTIEVTIQNSANATIKVPIEMISLSKLNDLHGIIAITAKSYANASIFAQIKEKKSPMVIMQNGIGVENNNLLLGFSEIYRCVLYSTSQRIDTYSLRFSSISASPVGVIKGNNLKACVEYLNTPEFAFYEESHIQEEIWKKAIINSVFNSICPLLDVDNGIFVRNEKITALAKEIVAECMEVAQCLGLKLEQQKIMEKILKISQGSEGQFISTLQDIRNGKQTEIESLNLEIARIAETMTPKIDVRKTKLLGTMIQVKSLLHRKSS